MSDKEYFRLKPVKHAEKITRNGDKMHWSDLANSYVEPSEVLQKQYENQFLVKVYGSYEFIQSYIGYAGCIAYCTDNHRFYVFYEFKGDEEGHELRKVQRKKRLKKEGRDKAPPNTANWEILEPGDYHRYWNERGGCWCYRWGPRGGKAVEKTDPRWRI